MSQVGSVVGPQYRRIVAGMGRAELEDRHISLMEENHLLKKHVRSQEEKMKKMATKLLRLAADEKREAKRDGHPPSVVQVRELEGEIQELLAKIRNLERTNSSLQNKIAVLRQQCESKGKRRNAYDHVQPRISSGTRRQTPRGSRSAQSSPATPRYGRSLLEEARRDNQELEDLVLRLKEEVSVLTAESEKNQQQLKLQAAEHEHQRLSFEQHLLTRSTNHQKRDIEEGVEVIRVQREMREKSDRLLVIQSQYSALERNLEAMKTNHSKLMQEMEHLNTRLKAEQTRSVELQSRVNAESVSRGRVAELEQVVCDLQEEREILKRSNDRLMKSPFVEDRGRVRGFRDSIGESERPGETHLTPSAHTLRAEREVNVQLFQGTKAHHSVHTQRLLQDEVLKGEVGSRGGGASRGTGSGWRVRDVGVGTDAATDTSGDELHNRTDLRHELFDLRLSQVEAAAELEKTRHLLAAQRAVNQDCQKEILVLWDQLSKHHSKPSTELLSNHYDTPTHSRSRNRHSERTKRTGGSSGGRESHRRAKKKKTAKREREQTIEMHTHSEESQAESKHSSKHRNFPATNVNSGVTKPSQTAHHTISVGDSTEHSRISPTGVERERDRAQLQTPPPSGVISTDGGTSRQQQQQVSERENQQQVEHQQQVLEREQQQQVSERKHQQHVSERKEGENEGRESPPEVAETVSEMSDDVSVSSSTQSSPEMGTPSTSTPLRPPLPPLRRAQDTHPAPPLPPFSSSISVITEAPPPSMEPHPPETEGGVREGGGEEGSGDSVSVTVTELSEGEEEDTMFEETLPQNTTTGSTISGRSFATPTTPTRPPSVRLASEDDEQESPVVSLTTGDSPLSTSAEEEDPLTPRAPLALTPDPRARRELMSLCIESLVLEPGCSLLGREDILGYFVEFQLLNYNCGDLETPSVMVPPPQPTTTLRFNFRKDFQVGPSQKSLLASILNSGHPDRKVLFTVVSEPVDQEMECEEVGSAELDLFTVAKSGKDIVNKKIRVVGSSGASESLGQLTVSLYAGHIFQKLNRLH